MLCLASIKKSGFNLGNLMARGWQGPGHCGLCLSGEDSIHHLFVDCSITRSIFAVLGSSYHCKWPVSDSSLGSLLESWSRLNSLQYYIPFFVFWCIWKARNRAIFEDSRTSQGVLISMINLLIYRFFVSERKTKPRIIGLALVCYIRWFSLMVQPQQGRGGGVFIAIRNVHSFYIKLGCGMSTNTLLALWALLYWENFLGLPYMHIFGDSSVIINWAMGKAALACLVLDN